MAAFNIEGATYHFALGLGISIDEESDQYSEGKLAMLQADWRGTEYIILDEKSMVGRIALGRISKALCQIFPHSSHLPFGGLSVLLFGDFGQLSPVGDTALIHTNRLRGTSYRDRLSNYGLDIFAGFKGKTYILVLVMRQAGLDPTTMAFKTTLAGLRDGTPSPEDYALLRTRFYDQLSLHEQSQFSKALRLCSTQRSVQEINIHALVKSGQPVLRSPAQHTGSGAAQAGEEAAQGLPAGLLLMIGAHVMLSRNLWVRYGLVNGARGTISKIGLSLSETPHHSVPSVVMIALPSYTGPTKWHTPDNIPLVPIIPQVARWDGPNGQRLTRRQLPLKLAFAITIHKSQGMTLDRVVVDLGEKEFSRGLSFVAISRVRTLQGLAFRPGFTQARLESIKRKDAVAGPNVRGRLVGSDGQ